MTLAAIIQDRTNDGISIVDFLFAVMRNELAGFKPCHRLDAAKLLVKYDCDEALNFNLDYIPEPSRRSSGSSEDSYFDEKLAKVIREATDDGRSVCRFLINVMEGELKQFKPHHRISAARELLDRGFGKHARQASSFMQRPPLPAGEGWGEGENQEHQPTPSHTTQPTESHKSPDPTNQSNVTPYSDTGSDNPEDDEGWTAFWGQVTPILDEDDRRKAEQEPDPPYATDMSVFDEAWDNSEKWFYEWKNSLDPEEYEAIVARELTEFYGMIDTKIERRKQIAEEQECREKEEAERQAEQARARAEAKEKAESEEPDKLKPPTRSQHKKKLMFVLGDSIYVDCEHPDCDLHDDDRSRWQGSVQYGAGPTTGHFP